MNSIRDAIKKALGEPQSMVEMLRKGDEPGHEFRGNQYADGSGQMGRTDKIGDQHKERNAAIAAQEAAQTAALKDTKGFTDGMSPMQAAKAVEVLNSNRSFNGRLATIKQEVQDRVAAGAKVSQGKEGRRLEMPDGRYLAEKNITKTGMDFAVHLIGKV